MSNQIQSSTFSFETHAIRTVVINNDPWFIAKDVCNAIGLSNSRMALGALDDDEKGVTSTYTLGGEQDLAIISESGMYTLILRCRDAVKKGSVPHRFRKWVTAEVLPQIRKTGQYSQNQQQNLPPAKNEIEVVEPTLTPKQQYQIQELVQGVHVHTEMSYAEIYSRLKNKFKVAKYDQIPQSRYREAIKYLGGLPMMDMPKPVELSMFEVLPLAIMLGHLRTLMVDFNIIHSQLKNKDDTLAKMLDNHYRQFNSSAPLFHRVQSAIARLIDSLPEKEREFAFDMVYKI